MRLLLAVSVGALGLAGFVGTASAQTVNQPCLSQANTSPGANSTASNDQDCSNAGDSDAAADQEGNASSGDGVAGQVAGVVSAGDASVDATNRSDDVSVDTGDATGANAAVVTAGAGSAHAIGGAGNVIAPCRNITNTSTGANSLATNPQDCSNVGDADAAADQAADAASGDGVGGQVIGVVTSAGGSADLVLDNESTDSSVDTGNGTFANGTATNSRAVTFFAGP